jgi:integrase
MFPRVTLLKHDYEYVPAGRVQTGEMVYPWYGMLNLEVRGSIPYKDHGLVFTTTKGTPINVRNVTRWFHQILERAELPRIRFHDLRHTAASLLLAQGVEPRVIMETLGHSQISLTLNTYSHVMPQMQRVAADRMDDLFNAEKRGS